MNPSERSRRRLTGLFVILGSLCFLPLMWIGIGFFCFLLYITGSVLRSLRWDSYSSFLESLIDNHHLDPDLKVIPIWLVFIVLYGFLLWQWMACLFRRRTLLYPRRLWAVSSVYFGAFMIFLQVFSLMLLENADDTTEWLTLWFIMACAIPFLFIVLSMRLWQSTPHPCNEFEEPHDRLRPGKT